MTTLTHPAHADLQVPSIATVLVASGTVVIAPDGGRWCMLGRNGFTRTHGTWWWGNPTGGPVCEVTATDVITALDSWCTQHAAWWADDLTPAHGLTRTVG